EPGTAVAPGGAPAGAAAAGVSLRNWSRPRTSSPSRCTHEHLFGTVVRHRDEPDRPARPHAREPPPLDRHAGTRLPGPAPARGGAADHRTGPAVAVMRPRR